MNSSHSAQALPATIEEIRRILLLHSAESVEPAEIGEEP